MFNQNRVNQQLLNNAYGGNININGNLNPNPYINSNYYQQNQGLNQNAQNYNNYNNNINPYHQSQFNQQQQQQQFPQNSNLNQNYPQFENVIFNDLGNFIKNQQFAADTNPLLQQKKSKHIQALIATILLIGGQSILIGLYSAGQTQLSLEGVIGIAIGIYFVYLMIALCCNSMGDYLSNLDQGSKFNQTYQQIRQINGKFVFHATCYHYQTRFHMRTVTDKDGHTTFQTYTTQQKIVTHSASQDLIPNFTKDDSGGVDQVRAMTNIIFVNYIIGYKFIDNKSQNYFHDFYADFRRRHYNDVYQDYSWNYQLPKFQSKRSFFIGQKKYNFKCWFYLSAIFVMLWPYSLYVQTLITRYHIQFMKILSFF